MNEAERRYLERARVARLATADDRGRPSVVPVCFALSGGAVWIALDEKPKRGDPRSLRRVRDVEANPYVSLVADHYVEEWDRLGWVQVRGRARVVGPDGAGHAGAVSTLRGKYDQYADHSLDERPALRVDPGHVVSWGTLDP